MSESRRRIDLPIIIFAFERAPYLRRFCESLKAQQGVEIDETRIFLLQDGAVSRKSGVRYAEDAALAASVAAFREVFPRGQVVQSPENLGISGNIRRGERLAFEALDASMAYFFEDDLELGPVYLLMMERLREALAPFPQVAYFAAYGDHRLEPRPDRLRLVPLDHHWGFALRRDAWRRISEWLAPYHALIGRNDYPHRNHLGVFRWMAQFDMAIDKSSQDAVKALAAAQLGLARVMVDACFARYIGERGASFSTARFQALGYDRMTPRQQADLPLGPVTEKQISRLLLEQQQHFRSFRAEAFDDFLARYSARHWDPDRLLTREDISALYRLLLDRAPEEAVYERNLGSNSVLAMRRGILASTEFRSRPFL
ncbi:hypothetical protein NON00_20740 [Roseomonas sp. GC11]|uniref:hypothetical protein n=1 Tax=Roseomonas sp. GC11 TaxID=2950546 RepID=UPI00210CA02A|nr:hypothetical protein [Roseomonas sp. GC11]MCQ4162343.1 hypothetical protein [Roseomonas sp. GC11]